MKNRICLIFIFLFLGINAHAQSFFDTSYLVISTQLHFESDEWQISDRDTADLSLMVHKSGELDSGFIWIKAHTDSDGGQEFNMKLSEQRAESVKQFLMLEGYDSSLFRVEFFGETRPDTSNNSDVGKAANRRVEVELYARQRMTWLFGQVVNDSTEAPVSTEVLLYAKNFSDSTWSDSLGYYRLPAPIKEEVVIEVRAKEYLPQFLSVAITPLITKKALNIRTSKIKIGGNFKLLNLLFFGNQSRPLPVSRRSLKVVGRFLIDNPGVCVEIQGHINHPDRGAVTAESSDFFLSVARARVVYDYLQMFNDISSDRMYYRGYGDWEMLFPHSTTEREQRLNRRVEIHICTCEQSKNSPNSEGSDKYQFYKLQGKENLFN
ncbi:MAG: OmpA family protein [Saprospiraceae bacterium]|nr:OmpA family protein [Saprospiraceae bacterium]